MAADTLGSRNVAQVFLRKQQTGTFCWRIEQKILFYKRLLHIFLAVSL